jgi:shikimate dehydrogenase
MRFGVVGDPVAHSRSPVMHTAGYTYLGIDAVYELIETPTDAFASIVARLRDGSLDGVNVTMPHKQNAYAAAESVDATVERLGAVNTLIFDDDELRGFNTDIDGVQHALSRLELASDTPVHVLGSGGAAAAAVVTTLDTRHVSISGRHRQRVSELLKQLGSTAPILPWGSSPEGAIVINATPLGMHGEELPPGIVESSVGLIDMPYGDAPTPSIRIAESNGIPHADGLVMLSGQAARAFRIFTGADVPVGVLEAAARG